MSRSTRKWIVACLAVVTVLASAINGYLAFAGHAFPTGVSHSHASAADHHSHDIDVDSTQSAHVAGDIQQSVCGHAVCNDHGEGDDDRTHIHVHQCCGSPALAADEDSLDFDHSINSVRLNLAGSVPIGQITYPLLRPPRVSA